jgi:hypothetical protein
MKRISKRISIFAIAILAILPNLTKATGYQYDTRYRVRWSPYTHGLVWGYVKYSPYAKKYGNSGLVYYRMKYSPYAKKYGNTGLVYDNVRYSPYAFGLKSSGLVSDPWGQSYDYYRSRPYQSAGPCIVVCNSTSRPSYPSTGGSTTTYNRTKNNSRAKSAARQAKIELRNSQRELTQAAKEYSGKDIIGGYLNLKNIDYRINRILSIENNLISVDFILTDKNTIIKYWNPEKILALQKEKNPRIRTYENYLESYKDFAGEYFDSGGQIYQIISADEKEILTKLLEFQKQCDEQEPDETTTVAKAGEDSTAVAMAD